MTNVINSLNLIKTWKPQVEGWGNEESFEKTSKNTAESTYIIKENKSQFKAYASFLFLFMNVFCAFFILHLFRLFNNKITIFNDIKFIL